MARLDVIDVDPARVASLPERVGELTRQVNDRLRLVRTTINVNEGAAVNWTDAALPTAAIDFAGRLLYHNMGQAATADKLYTCLWNGAAWAWVLIA